MSMIHIDESQASELCGSMGVPPPGYMRAVVVSGVRGWLRHLYVSGVLLFESVDSFPPGVGVGALRKMYH